MTKYLGAVLLAAASLLWWTGYEPFSRPGERLQKQRVQRGPNGSLLWSGGMHGGK